MRDAGWIADAWQERVLRSTAGRVLLLCGRQMGKSTVVACRAVHQALYRPGSLVLLLAPAERQSEELLRRVLSIYDTLGRPVAAVRELKTCLELANDSRIISLPGSEATIRCFSDVDLLVIDEAARVDDALLPSTAPMIGVSKGALMMLSTPFGRRGVFFDTWESTDPAWDRIRARASECPRLDRSFLDEQRRLWGPRWYDQEYETAFVETTGAVFSTESIEQCFRDTDEPIPILQGF
jgi:hypothetical protein